MDEQRGGRFANILKELWGSRGEVHKSSENYGFFRGRLLRYGHRAREGAAYGVSVRPLLSPREVVASGPRYRRSSAGDAFFVQLLRSCLNVEPRRLLL